MTKKNNTYSVVSGKQQDAERSLLEYLKPKQEDRFSKLEAYCDLLSRASNGATVCQYGDKRLELLPGQFVATVSDLARTWQWQRATVRQFLEGLVTLGQVQMEPFVKSYVFTVDKCKRMTLTVNNTDDLLDYCCMQFARYADGRLPAEDVAGAFDHYFGMKAELAMNGDSPSQTITEVVQSQITVFCNLVKFLHQKATGCNAVAAPVVDASRLLFGREGLWKWQNVISCLDILAAAFAEDTLPGSMSRLKKTHSEAELSLMDSIIKACTADTETSDSTQEPTSPPSRLDVSSLEGKVAGDNKNAPLASVASESASEADLFRR